MHVSARSNSGQVYTKYSTKGTPRLVILRSRNGDEAAGCDLEGAIQGGVGDLANVS